MNKGGNILVLTQWSFKDALVQTYTLPYVEMIRKTVPATQKILLVTAEQPHLTMSTEEMQTIRNEWGKKNMQLIAQPYRKFGVRKLLAAVGQLIRLYRLTRKEKIKVIHAFCTPAGAVAYLLSKASGATLIIDSYEPHAEAMVENGTWTKSGIAYKILFALEKKQTRRASVLIATTAGMKQYALQKYGVEPKQFFVKPACVNLDIFFPQPKDQPLLDELQLGGKIVCVYAGKLGGIYLKEEVFDFIKSCYNRWKDNFRFLMLTNAPRQEVSAELIKKNLPENIAITRFVFHREIPRYLSLGDFAINPVKPVRTKQYCTSIKDGEYWAMGLPVVISPRISDDSAIIEKENTGVVVDFTDTARLEEAVLKVETLLNGKKELAIKIRRIAENYRSFEIAEKIYKTIYSTGH